MTQIQGILTAEELVKFMWNHKTGKFFDESSFLYGYTNWILSVKAKRKPKLVIQNAKELVEQVWPLIFDGEKRDYYNNLRASTEAWINHYINK